jgi:hypothetical protein
MGPLSVLSDVEVAAGIPPRMLKDPSWSVVDTFLPSSYTWPPF